jgi:hypothetical protein
MQMNSVMNFMLRSDAMRATLSRLFFAFNIMSLQREGLAVLRYVDVNVFVSKTHTSTYGNVDVQQYSRATKVFIQPVSCITLSSAYQTWTVRRLLA